MPSGSDALLVLSFGGPEGPAGRAAVPGERHPRAGVPPERLDAVEEHYRHFGGVSPLNARNRELIAAVRARTDLPVYFGNRNWHPMVEDTVAQMARDGVRRALVFATSAYGGYSACRQYHEDIARARKAVGEGAPELVRLRHFFDHPAFVAANADAVRAAFAQVGPGARLVFTAHSVPSAADATAGPPAEGGHRYSRQVAEAARLVAAAVGVEEYDVVWQSRSGPPQVPWLAPGHPRPPRRAGRRGRAGGGRRAGRVRVRPRRGGVGPRHRGPRAGRRAGHGLRPGGHGRARPAVRGHGRRAGGRAHRGRAAAAAEHGPRARDARSTAPCAPRTAARPSPAPACR